MRYPRGSDVKFLIGLGVGKQPALARYAMDGLPNKIMAANYKTGVEAASSIGIAPRSAGLCQGDIVFASRNLHINLLTEHIGCSLNLIKF